VSQKARRVVHDLFTLYLAEPQCLPAEWRQLAAGPDEALTARVAADYLAGMTYRFALDEPHRLFDTHARHDSIVGGWRVRLTYDMTPVEHIAYLRMREPAGAQVETVRLSDVDLAPNGTVYGIEFLNELEASSFWK
jgi:hypothetical protein